jgi:hypothetical protein
MISTSRFFINGQLECGGHLHPIKLYSWRLYLTRLVWYLLRGQFLSGGLVLSEVLDTRKTIAEHGLRSSLVSARTLLKFRYLSFV